MATQQPNPAETITHLLDQFSAYLEQLKEIRDHMLKELSLQASGSEPKKQYLRIAEFILASRNRPKTARELARGLGISRSSLSQILHRTHKDKFMSASIPGYSKKKLWALTGDAAREAGNQLQGVQLTLFDTPNELSTDKFSVMKAVDCCALILRENDNDPMNALTMAREAIRRGYRGKARGSEDEVLLTTAKSFWAALGRDERFEEVRPLVFRLKKS